MVWPFSNKNSTSKIYQAIGFYKDQHGIMERYVQEVSNWKDHLGKTRKFIIKEARNHEKSSIAILGSGWLLDVPIDDLCSSFEKVYLIDIKHPVRIKHQLKERSNIIFLEADISGFALPVYNLVKSGQKENLAALQPAFNVDLSTFDFVVSCNIMDQLDGILTDYLKKYFKLTPQEESTFRLLVQQTHLSILPKGKSCLITDLEEMEADRSNTITSRKPVIFATIPQSKTSAWTWYFDTKRTYNAGSQTWYKVVAQRI